MPRPASLSLTMPQSTSAVSSTMTSPVDAGSGFSSPDSFSAHTGGPTVASRHHKSTKSVPLSMSGSSSPHIPPASPELTSLPAFPSSPKDPSRHARDASKGFFSNLKASRSSNKVPGIDSSIRQISAEAPQQSENPPSRGLYALRKSPGSTPDLSLSNFDVGSNDDGRGPIIDRQDVRPMASSIGSDGAIQPNYKDPQGFKKPKPRFHNLIGRTKSIRVDADGRRSKPATPITVVGPSGQNQYDGINESDDNRFGPHPPRTAPLRPDRALRDMMASNPRGRSADRPSSNHSNENQRPRQLGPPSSASNSTAQLSTSAPGFQREGAGSHLFANIKSTSSKAADGLGRAGKGLLRRMERRPSSIGREDEQYTLKIINLPLVEQTRKTRIAARLEDSKDKTEFWMPSLPWRCIDYLNFKGCEEEGIYRIPGSELQIRHWQKRFDREGDIDLFEEHELYDINIIGSMFKGWLRDLPNEIFPKSTQATIARENPGAEVVPQMLRDELSKLPPWNYYLLFAITCHLSLLTAYADKNKMTYNNLCVCFQPCLKIEAYCFRFLVEQWRDCWQGCFTEKEALEDEYRILDGFMSSGGESSEGPLEEQLYGSSPGTKATIPVRGKPPALHLNRMENEVPPPTPTAPESDEPNGHTAKPSMASRVPELAPMKPLSPIMTEFKNSSAEKSQHSQPRA